MFHRMSYRHRDRDNQRRSLVVWGRVLRPHWIRRCRLHWVWTLRARGHSLIMSKRNAATWPPNIVRPTEVLAQVLRPCSVTAFQEPKSFMASATPAHWTFIGFDSACEFSSVRFCALLFDVYFFCKLVKLQVAKMWFEPFPSVPCHTRLVLIPISQPKIGPTSVETDSVYPHPEVETLCLYQCSPS